MKKFMIALSMLALVTTSCVSKKKYAELEARNKQTEDLLNTATVKLNMCLEEKNSMSYRVESLKNQNDLLKENNQQLISNMGNLTTRKGFDHQKLARCCNKTRLGEPCFSTKPQRRFGQS